MNDRPHLGKEAEILACLLQLYSHSAFTNQLRKLVSVSRKHVICSIVFISHLFIADNALAPLSNSS